MLFNGDDWAEDHHDVELVDDEGRVLARRRLPEGIGGRRAVACALIADHLPADWVEMEPEQVQALGKVGIETGAQGRGETRLRKGGNVIRHAIGDRAVTE